MTITKEDQFEAIRVRLEERYELHTSQLGNLIAGGKGPGSVPVNTALRFQSRKALSEIARALRHMAEGSYGRCLDCESDIPIEQLEVRPDAPLCATCQQRQERPEPDAHSQPEGLGVSGRPGVDPASLVR